MHQRTRSTSDLLVVLEIDRSNIPNESRWSISRHIDGQNPGSYPWTDQCFKIISQLVGCISPIKPMSHPKFQVPSQWRYWAMLELCYICKAYIKTTALEGKVLSFDWLNDIPFSKAPAPKQSMTPDGCVLWEVTWGLWGRCWDQTFWRDAFFCFWLFYENL